MSVKQVIVIRKDLNMRKGKMCSQAAHASMGAIFVNSRTEFDEIGQPHKMIPLSDSVKSWFDDRFTKIVVGCDSEKELLEIAEKATNAKLMRFLCQDSGKTEFGGEPTYTALAIGPADSEEIDKITGHLKLL